LLHLVGINSFEHLEVNNVLVVSILKFKLNYIRHLNSVSHHPS